MSRNTQTFSQILETIDQLTRERRSGTLYITTDDNHSARFVMADGEISAIGYRQLHGYDAVPKMQQIRGGSYRFTEGSFLAMKTVPLPKTDELLAMLREGNPPNGSRQAIPSGSFNGKLVAVRHELILHLGPIADLVWDEYIEDHGEPLNQHGYDAMIQTLAAEIDDPAKRVEFKHNARHLRDKG